MKSRTKLKLLQTSGFIATFSPLGIAVGLNINDYVTTTGSAVALTLGGSLAVLVTMLQVAGKGKAVLGNGLYATGIAFALLVFLEPIILNLKFLVGMMFAGEAGYTILFKNAIIRQKKIVDYETQAGVMKDVLRGGANQ